jgi:predicted Zn-dependent protease
MMSALTELATLHLRSLGLDAYEVAYEARDEQILRYANNIVGQATARSLDSLNIKIWAHGGRSSFEFRGDDRDELKTSIDTAVERARTVALSGFTSKVPELAPADDLNLQSDRCDPEIIEELGNRGSVTRGLESFFARAAADKVEIAGRLDMGKRTIALLNSAGLSREFSCTSAQVQAIAVEPADDHISGFASNIGGYWKHLELDSVADRATRKCVQARKITDISPGTYDVILEPDAVAEIMMWLNGIGFSATSLEEKQSFMAGHIDEQIVSEKLSIADDGNCPHGLGLPQPFDAEGTPKARVDIIDKGVAKGFLFDNETAARMGCSSTGHASSGDIGPRNEPTGHHLEIAAGVDSEESLIAKVDRGLWVTRFHYVNGLLDPPRAVMTGLTRDGTFLIENGRIGPSVGMLRFTDSIVDAFSRIDGLTEIRRAVAEGYSGKHALVAPTILIRGLKFTGGAKG